VEQQSRAYELRPHLIKVRVHVKGLEKPAIPKDPSSSTLNSEVNRESLVILCEVGTDGRWSKVPR